MYIQFKNIMNNKRLYFQYVGSMLMVIGQEFVKISVNTKIKNLIDCVKEGGATFLATTHIKSVGQMREIFVNGYIEKVLTSARLLFIEPSKMAVFFFLW